MDEKENVGPHVVLRPDVVIKPLRRYKQQVDKKSTCACLLPLSNSSDLGQLILLVINQSFRCHTIGNTVLNIGEILDILFPTIWEVCFKS